MNSRDFAGTLDRLAQDELAASGCRLSELPVAAELVVTAVCGDGSMSLADAIEAIRRDHPGLFRPRREGAR